MGEITAAYHKLFGRPTEPPVFPQIFGRGAAFTFGEPGTMKYRIPESLRSQLLHGKPGLVDQYERLGGELMESGLLRGPATEPSPEWGASIRSPVFGERYANGEIELAARLHGSKYATGRNLDRAMMATEMVDILRPLTSVAIDVGLDLHSVLTGGQADPTALFNSLPSRVVAGALRRARHVNPQQTWKANDLNDIAALALIVPYCDVVITEKSWVHHANAAKLGQRFGTVLLHDVADLVDVIVDSSRN